MTDLASVVPDTRVPVAAELLQPSGAQQVTPIEDSVSSRRDADDTAVKSSQPAAQASADDGKDTRAGQAAAQEVKPGGKIMPMLKAPLKGPRGGIHWGADRMRLMADKAKTDFAHPLGVKPKHRKIVRFFGQFGWILKGLVYAIIGGVACQASAQDKAKINGADISPQGAFILVGNNGFGYPLLVVMAVGVLTYACWRFWEGITGQGSDDAFGPYKNFFRYRLSPCVSGAVYTAYGIFVITLIPRFKSIESADNQGGFPDSWSNSGIGKFGIAIFGLAFLIATITQLQAAFTRNFHYDMKDDLPNWFMWVLIVTGHIGFLGRAGVFVFVGVLFFRLIANPELNNSDETTIGNGLAQLQKNRGGRACLFILGFFLIVYGLFAVLNAYGKVYPTPPPSRRPIRVRQARQAAEEAAKEGDQPGVDGKGHEADGSSPDDHGRHKLGEPAWNHPHHDLPEGLAHDPQDSPKTADYKQRERERYLAHRDIESGLGEEWAAKGQLGSAERPHWGHGFFRNSRAQSESNVAPVDSVTGVAPVAPVVPVAPVDSGVQMGQMTSPAPILGKPPSSGWV